MRKPVERDSSSSSDSGFLKGCKLTKPGPNIGHTALITITIAISIISIIITIIIISIITIASPPTHLHPAPPPSLPSSCHPFVSHAMASNGLAWPGHGLAWPAMAWRGWACPAMACRDPADLADIARVNLSVNGGASSQTK